MVGIESDIEACTVYENRWKMHRIDKIQHISLRVSYSNLISRTLSSPIHHTVEGMNSGSLQATLMYSLHGENLASKN